MKKIIAIVVSVVLTLALCTAAFAESTTNKGTIEDLMGNLGGATPKPDNPGQYESTRAFIDVLEENGITYEYHGILSSSNFERITIGISDDDIGIDYEIIVLFSQTNENATVRVWDLVFFDPNNMYNVLDAINKCNREWRYTTFYAEEDNTITVQIDVIFRDGTAGEVTWEATGRLVDIIEGAYTDHLSGIAVK